MSGSAPKNRQGKRTSDVKDHDFEKIMRYCAFRPRNRFEVDKKMQEMGLCESIRKKYLTRLLKSQMVQDEVYLESFILGKLRKNRWGRQKIAYQLRLQGFSGQIISRALRKYVDPAEYETIASRLLMMRQRFFKQKDFTPAEAEVRCLNYMISKGFEKELIQKLCKEVVQGSNSTS